MLSKLRVQPGELVGRFGSRRACRMQQLAAYPFRWMKLDASYEPALTIASPLSARKQLPDTGASRLVLCMFTLS